MDHFLVNASLEQGVASAHGVHRRLTPGHMLVLSCVHANLVALEALRRCQPPKRPTKPVLGPRARPQCWRQAVEVFAVFLELRAREAPAEVRESSLQEAFGRWYATAEAEVAEAVVHRVPRGEGGPRATARA